MRRTALALLATLALSSAISAQYDPSAPEPISRIDGSLVIAGGGELPESIFERFLKLAGGDDARLVVIPTASSQADRVEGHERVARSWRQRGVAQVQVLHTRSREQADGKEFTQPLREATAVWFGGGVQSRIARAYQGTRVERELAALLERGGVIGGTSAGAAILSAVMIAGGDRVATLGRGFDLLPGAVVDQHFTERGREARLRSVIASHPHLVGVGVDEQTALIVRGRRLMALGTGGVTILVAASESRPWRKLRLREEDGRANRADLIALAREAAARTLPAFPPDPPPVPHVESGTLMIVGGGRLPDGLLEEFVELAGGPEAPIVYVPCSEAVVIEAEPRMVQQLRDAGAQDVTWIHTKDRARADHDEEFLAPLRDARGIWFGGGRQWNLVDSYQHTRAHRLMEEVLERGGVIGGSSAGASIQADYLCRGDPLQNFNIIAPGYETGLGFLRGVGVDQHFFRRNRLPDMTELVEAYPQLLGIGIDEGTALIVRGSVARVVGHSKVAFYDRCTPVVPGEPDYVALTAGATYDLATREVVEPATPPTSDG